MLAAVIALRRMTALRRRASEVRHVIMEDVRCEPDQEAAFDKEMADLNKYLRSRDKKN